MTDTTGELFGNPEPPPDGDLLGVTQPIDTELNTILLDVINSADPPTLGQMKDDFLKAVEGDIIEGPKPDNPIRRLIQQEKIFDSQEIYTVPVNIDAYTQLINNLLKQGVSPDKIRTLTRRYASIHNARKHI